MDTLLAYYKEWMEISKSNPLMASFFGVWVAGLVTYMVRNVPLRIWNFFKRQFTTTLTINNAGWENAFQYEAFLRWFKDQPGANFSRSFSVQAEQVEYKKAMMGIGFGTHVFFYKRHFFWLYVTALQSSGSTNEKHQIEIVGLTRNRQLIIDMVEDFKFKPNAAKMMVYHFTGKDWERFREIEPRRIETVMAANGLKEKLIGQIQNWIDNEDWYRARGMTYKLAYVLHGIPGTGKTSLIKALASYFHRDVYVLNLASLMDYRAANALAAVPRNAVLLVEDFDAAKAARRRADNSQIVRDANGEDRVQVTENVLVPVDQADSGNRPPVIRELESGNGVASLVDQMMEGFEVSTSSLLNLLDGIVSLDGVLMFFTTNHIEKIDPAMLRKGRISHIYEVTALSNKEVRDYIGLMFPDFEVPENVLFKDIPGCDLEALFLDHMDNVEGFYEAIPKYHGTKVSHYLHTHNGAVPDVEKQVA